MIPRIDRFEQQPIGQWLFELPVESVNLFGKKFDGKSVSAGYSRHAELFLEFEVSGVHPFEGIGLTEFSVNDDLLDDEVTLDVLNAHFDSKDGRARITGEPLNPRKPVLINFGGQANRVEAIMVNGPRLATSHIPIVFSKAGYELELRQFGSAEEYFKNTNAYRHERVATSCLSVHRHDGSPIEPECATRQLEFTTRFLSFVRGTWCAKGNVIGYDAAGEVVFASLGFGPADHFKAPANWYSWGLSNEISGLFPLYVDLAKGEDDRFPLIRTIEFYMAANAAGGRVETALVVSYSALETIVHHTLQAKAGWSATLVGRGSHFHDKLRAACAFIGLNVDPMECLSALKKRAVQEECTDAFEALSRARNRLVHAKKSHKYTAIELSEAWRLSQWLCEIFVFYWLDYRGQMRNRLTGTREKVPLP